LISFRYHVVTIVAIFLALALGVLLGTTVVNQGVVENLSRRTNDAARRSEQLRSQVTELQSQLRDWDRFGAAVEPMLVSGQLTSRQVVLVTQEGVDAGEVAGIRKALQDAGASVVSVIVVTNRMALRGVDDQNDLRTLLGAAAGEGPSGLAQLAARELAARLSTPLSPGAADVLRELLDARFLVLRGGAGPIDDIGQPDQAVSILAGGNRDPILAPQAFLAPLTSALVESAWPVAAAETTTTVYPFVPLLRQDGALGDRLVTVDNADTMPGRIALVLGLRDLLENPGKGGHFGIKGGAAALIPQP
jgi:copper transport outer membrane protein MctB